jgi:hypothetical protein
VAVPEPDRHDRELEAWVLAAVVELDVEGLKLGLGARELPVPGVAERARMDERVVGVVVDRLAQRGLVRLLDHADPARVVLTPAGRRAAATEPTPTEPPAPDGSRFVFLRPAAPHGPGGGGPDDEQVCDFHPQRRRKGVMDAGGEYCDGSGWIVDAATRTSRPCRCRPLRIARNRDRRLGGRITTEILNYGLASSLHPELHPALHPVLARWTADVDAQLDAGRGLWMTVADWDRRAARDAPGALDEDERPPRTQAEFEAAAARAGRALDADALTDQRHREQASKAGGELSLMEVRKVAETAAGSSAAAIARAAHHAGRGVALYSLSSLYRSLVHLSRHGGYRERLDALRTADLVVLVGLDQEVLRRAAPWQRDWLSEQLELIAIGRYEHVKSTVIVSTGWPLEQLQEALSAETFHRLACAAGEPLLASRLPAAAPAHAATVT